MDLCAVSLILINLVLKVLELCVHRDNYQYGVVVGVIPMRNYTVKSNLQITVVND